MTPDELMAGLRRMSPEQRQALSDEHADELLSLLPVPTLATLDRQIANALAFRGQQAKAARPEFPEPLLFRVLDYGNPEANAEIARLLNAHRTDKAMVFPLGVTVAVGVEEAGRLEADRRAFDEAIRGIYRREFPEPAVSPCAELGIVPERELPPFPGTPCTAVNPLRPLWEATVPRPDGVPKDAVRVVEFHSPFLAVPPDLRPDLQERLPGLGLEPEERESAAAFHRYRVPGDWWVSLHVPAHARPDAGPSGLCYAARLFDPQGRERVLVRVGSGDPDQPDTLAVYEPDAPLF